MRAAFIALALCLSGQAVADDAPDEERLPRERSTIFRDFRFALHGYLRTRADVFDDLDLSRGPTPSGTTVFPTPAAGQGHTMTGLDMRLRVEPELSVGQTVRFHARFDILDNLAWGSTPNVLPSTTAQAYATTYADAPTTGINSFSDAVRVKQAWGEVTLPFGTLSAGRMGALVNWGTGFFLNDGSCLDCDLGDAGDRIALTVPLVGHLFTGLYELSSSGPTLPLGFGQSVRAESQAAVNTVALSMVRYASPEAQRRTLEAGRTLVQYGILLDYRWQNLDAPAWVQPGGLSHPYGPSAFVKRNARVFATDIWFLIHKGPIRWELEAATILGQVADASGIPGIELRQPVVLRQWGGVTSLAYEFRFPLRLRLEVGLASGDSAYGFGARVQSAQATVRGDVDGPQLRPPVDNTIDNFNFSPDYHVDLVLWRRIVGRVTDGVYVKPTIRAGPFGNAQHHITFDVSVVDSTSLYATTPPGQSRRLGTELDLQARYRLELGFEARLSYGVLFPGDGWRNLELALEPRPAQVFEAILAYRM